MNLTFITALVSFILFGQSNLEGTDVFRTSVDYYNLRIKKLKEFKYSDTKIKNYVQPISKED